MHITKTGLTIVQICTFVYEVCYGWKISIYLFEHVLLMDRIHETGILTTEFIPVVLLTDGINENVIKT